MPDPTIKTEDLRLGIVKETTYGDIPTSPIWRELAFMSETLEMSPTYQDDGEIEESSRAKPDQFIVAERAGGSVSRYLRFNTVTDYLIESLFGMEFGDDPKSLFNATPGSGELDADDVVYDDDKIVSFAIEKRWRKANGNYSYHRMPGMVVASATFEWTALGEVTTNFTLMGADGQVDSAIVSGATYPALTAGSIMRAGEITSAGFTALDSDPSLTAWMSTACLNQATISFDNSSRARACTGSLNPAAIDHGELNATITGQMFYNGDNDAINAMLNSTRYGFIVQFADASANPYEIFFPRVQITKADVVAAGRGGDVMIAFEANAHHSPVKEYAAHFARIVRAA